MIAPSSGTSSSSALPPVDTAVADSLAADTLVSETVTALVWERPSRPETSPAASPAGNAPSSWVLLAVLLLFALVGIRFRSNSRYFRSLLSDLVEVRERHNVFDDTVRETSFRVLLNLLMAASSGITIYCSFVSYFGLPEVNAPLCQAVTIAAVGAYMAFMAVAYRVTGTVFSTKAHASEWVRTFWASQAVLGIALLPSALLLLLRPELTFGVIIYSISIFYLIKIIFFVKVFRIFFYEYSAWISFLYYLCALEIVPLILTYVGSLRLDRMIVVS